jgi:hypothetical protein
VPTERGDLSDCRAGKQGSKKQHCCTVRGKGHGSAERNKQFDS